MADIRLNKIIRKYNIGLQNLVDFLRSKGADVEANPNAKVSDNLLPEIEKQFGKDLELKEASEKVDIKLTEILEKTSRKQQEEQQEEEYEELVQETVIKSTIFTPAQLKPEPKPVPEPEPEPVPEPELEAEPEPEPEAEPREEPIPKPCLPACLRPPATEPESLKRRFPQQLRKLPPRACKGKSLSKHKHKIAAAQKQKTEQAASPKEKTKTEKKNDAPGLKVLGKIDLPSSRKRAERSAKESQGKPESGQGGQAG